MLVLFTKNLFFQKERREPVIETSVSKHGHLKTVRIRTLERHMRERGDSLLKETQKMRQVVLKHVLFMKAKRPTLETRYFV